MQKITTGAELKDAIKLLEDRKQAEQELFREEMNIFKERLKPANMVRNTFDQFFTAPTIIRSALILTAGVTTAFITKKYFQGITGKLFRKLLGKVI